MKTRYLLTLSISTVVALGIILVDEKSTVASEAIFYCQSNNNTPTTMVKTSNGAKQPVFHWNLDAVNIKTKPKPLCDSVTQKLNKYLMEGNDLSSLIFKASITFDQEDSTTLPAVCVARKEKPCQLLLFTLEPAPSENPQVSASNALDSILDKDLQATPVKSPTRGVQSAAYQVNFWQLLGL